MTDNGFSGRAAIDGLAAELGDLLETTPAIGGAA